LKIKQKKECANIKIFEIYEQKLNQTNYDWRCQWNNKGKANMHCIDKETCNKEICNCDK